MTLPPIRMPRINHNAHAVKIAAALGPLQAGALEVPDGLRFVFICFTNRSGSNYLAELIASAGTLNLAGEDLNWDVVIANCEKRGLDGLRAYFSWLCRVKASSGVLLVKAAISQLAMLNEAGILPVILSRSQFVMIERADKLGQAISHSLAFATGRFMSYVQGRKSNEEVAFSPDQITSVIAGIVHSNGALWLFFSHNGLVPAHVSYEQLAAFPKRTMAMLLDQLGLPQVAIDPRNLRLEKQADHVNDAWRSQYLAITADDQTQEAETP